MIKAYFEYRLIALKPTTACFFLRENAVKRLLLLQFKRKSKFNKAKGKTVSHLLSNTTILGKWEYRYFFNFQVHHATSSRQFLLTSLFLWWWGSAEGIVGRALSLLLMLDLAECWFRVDDPIELNKDWKVVIFADFLESKPKTSRTFVSTVIPSGNFWFQGRQK